MKIIRLTTFLDFGGIEKRLINIAHYNDCNEWLFCAINKGGFAERKIRENGKRVECFNCSYTIPSLMTMYKLYCFFKKEQPNVVHTSGAEANFHGVVAARLAGVNVVIAEEVGIPSHKVMAKFVFKWIYKIADYVIGNSNAVIDCLKDKTCVSSTKLRLIPNPILFPNIPERKIVEKDVFTLITVSRLAPVKNIELVLMVLGELSISHKVQFVVLGDGDYRNELERVAAQSGLRNSVYFLGFKEDPYPYLKDADLFILNSFSEGFSNALVEAMYSRIPVLATGVGAAEEIIEHGVNGWLIRPNNKSELLSVLKKLIEMPAMDREKVGEFGKQSVVEKYSLENHMKKLYEVYILRK